MAKNKKQTKEVDAWNEGIPYYHPSDGLTMSGPALSKLEMDEIEQPHFSYSYGDLGQLDMFDEMELQDKYPALKQAHEHYQSVLEVCKTKEKEDNED